MKKDCPLCGSTSFTVWSSDESKFAQCDNCLMHGPYVLALETDDEAISAYIAKYTKKPNNVPTSKYRLEDF